MTYWLNMKDASRWSGRSPSAIRKWINEGHVRSKLVKNRRYVAVDDLPLAGTKPRWQVAKHFRSKGLTT